MAWKSSFRQNYRTTFPPTVPTSAAGNSHDVADVEAPGGEKWDHLKSGGKQWQATPKNLYPDAAYQSHTSRLNELWSLPRPAQGFNTNNIYIYIYIYIYRVSQEERTKLREGVPYVKLCPKLNGFRDNGK